MPSTWKAREKQGGLLVQSISELSGLGFSFSSSCRRFGFIWSADVSSKSLYKFDFCTTEHIYARDSGFIPARSSIASLKMPLTPCV